MGWVGIEKREERDKGEIEGEGVGKDVGYIKAGINRGTERLHL